MNKKKALIAGGCGSLGMAIANRLYYHNDYEITCIDREIDIKMEFNEARPYQRIISGDARNNSAVLDGDWNVVINCCGVSAIANTKDINIEYFDKVFETNVYSTINLYKNTIDALIDNKGVFLAICSDAAYRPMRCSLLYNSSKAALDMAIKCLARENNDKDVTIFGIAPNRLKNTNMSKKVDEMVQKVRGWTKEYTEEYQLKALPRGETDADDLACYINYLLRSKDIIKSMHGLVLPYGTSGF